MESKFYFGIWLPGQGWLRLKNDIFADPSRELSQEVARYIGHRAHVRLVDLSTCEALEPLYLEEEKRTLWHYFRNLFKRKSSN